MTRHILPLAALAAILPAVILLAGPVDAQTAIPENAPIPKNGALVQERDGVPIGDQIDTGNLPGVDFDAPPADAEASGPGGLRNNVGAVGMSVPSQSSSNPVPIEPQTGDVGLAIGTPAPQ